jgi:hypothetical protein
MPMLEDRSGARRPRERQRLTSLGEEAVREGGVARAHGARLIRRERRQERERGRGRKQACATEAGMWVSPVRALRPSGSACGGRGRGAAPRVERRPPPSRGAGRGECVDLPRDGGHRRGDGEGGGERLAAAGPGLWPRGRGR